jgi:DNA helicase HerA-like ATPase
MKIFKKENDSIQVLCFPDETVEKGDYLLIEDGRGDRSLLVQVIDVQFANIPGIMEDLLRDQISDSEVFGEDYDTHNLGSQITVLRDVRLLVGKIRCSIKNNSIDMNISWLPSRTSSTIRCIKPDKLFQILDIGRTQPINIGETDGGSELFIDAGALDGGLSIITGMKGSGKSHLSKLLLLGLIDHGAPSIVLDVNGEYSNLGLSRNGESNHYRDRIVNMKVGENFKVTMKYAGLRTVSNIMSHNLGLPENSLREFHRLWKDLELRGTVSLKSLRLAVQTSNLNEHVKEAILSRIYALTGFGFFTDDEREMLRIEDVLDSVSNGGAMIVDLSTISAIQRRIAVEFMLGKIVELLRSWLLKAAFLFAEEAHLYLRETYWEDIVTRMRHLGLFTIFVTNQPDTINDGIYRQADSIFLFNFKNEHDLNALSKVSRIDNETMRSITQSLRPHHCLTIGHVTREVPLVVKVKPLDVWTMGETRRFFS